MIITNAHFLVLVVDKSGIGGDSFSEKIKKVYAFSITIVHRFRKTFELLHSCLLRRVSGFSSPTASICRNHRILWFQFSSDGSYFLFQC